MAEREAFFDGVNDSELADVEKLLAAFQPRAGRVSPLRVMYLAGQQSVHSPSTPRASIVEWLWPLSTSLLVIISVSLGIGLAIKPKPQVVERVVHVTAEPHRAVADEVPTHDGNSASEPTEDKRPAPIRVLRPKLSPPVFAADDYFTSRRLALSLGINALPDSTRSRRAREPLPSMHELRREMLARNGEKKSQQHEAGDGANSLLQLIRGDYQ